MELIISIMLGLWISVSAGICLWFFNKEFSKVEKAESEKYKK